MKIYLQRADGTETELIVMTPDPEDGTYTAFITTKELTFSNEDWLRIVPELDDEYPLK